MAVARCGHSVVVNNRRRREGPEAGQAKRRIKAKGPDPTLGEASGFAVHRHNGRKVGRGRGGPPMGW